MIPSRERAWSMSREIVIRRIVERETQKRGLTEEIVRQEVPELYQLACEQFGTWDTALKYAGVGVRQLYAKEDYHRERVIQTIRKHVRKRHNPTATYIRRFDPSLYKAARCHFGSWYGALHAADVKPKRARLRTGQFQRLDTKRILDTIRKWNAAGYSLVGTNVYLQNRALATAAEIAYGSWRRALVAAGVVAEKKPYRRQRKWSQQSVIEHIRHRQQEDKPVTAGAVGKDDGGLLWAATKYFGGWNQALAAAAAGATPKSRVRLQTRRSRRNPTIL